MDKILHFVQWLAIYISFSNVFPPDCPVTIQLLGPIDGTPTAIASSSKSRRLSWGDLSWTVPKRGTFRSWQSQGELRCEIRWMCIF